MILAVMAVVCGVADSLLEQFYYPLDAPWLYADDQSDNNPHINGLITFAFALITFQNIVPISLYISIEAVRTFQAAFIYFDKEIWYEKTDQAALARSWNLSDDLGQIEYIFSDKTGTLTQVCRLLEMQSADFDSWLLRTSWCSDSAPSAEKRTKGIRKKRKWIYQKQNVRVDPSRM